MKKNKKTILLVVTIAIILAIVVTTFFITLKDGKAPVKNEMPPADLSSMKIEYVQLNSLIDHNNKSAVIGSGDYTFIGYVDEFLRTEYEVDYTPTETLYTPSSLYSVTVLENIKGDLILNESIPMFRFGGINYDGKSVMADFVGFPEVGKAYIFTAWTNRKGEISIFDSAVLDVEITKENVKEAVEKAKESEVFKFYTEAYENEEFFSSRERYTSVYESTHRKDAVPPPVAEYSKDPESPVRHDPPPADLGSTDEYYVHQW